jgi:hypothetical protein
MKIKMHFKYSWWWKPAFKTVISLAVFRIISIPTAEKIANIIVNLAFKWRIGKTWNRITGLRVNLERQ